MSEEDTFSFDWNNIYDPKNFAGCYRLGGFGVNLKNKPCWLHRTMMRVCLGWIWADRDE